MTLPPIWTAPFRKTADDPSAGRGSQIRHGPQGIRPRSSAGRSCWPGVYTPPNRRRGRRRLLCCVHGRIGGSCRAKVAGEPHIEHSRSASQTVAALADRGYDPAQIAAMYDEPEQAIREAIDLERQLAGSVVAA